MFLLRRLPLQLPSPQLPWHLLPAALKKGDLVGLISPSAATADLMQFTFAKEAMEGLGLKVIEGKHLKNRRGHLAGTIAGRLAGNRKFKQTAC